MSEPRWRGGRILGGSSILNHVRDQLFDDGRIDAPIFDFANQEADRVLQAYTGHARGVGNGQDQVVGCSSWEGPHCSEEGGLEAVKVLGQVVFGKG